MFESVRRVQLHVHTFLSRSSSEFPFQSPVLRLLFTVHSPSRFRLRLELVQPHPGLPCPHHPHLQAAFIFIWLTMFDTPKSCLVCRDTTMLIRLACGRKQRDMLFHVAWPITAVSLLFLLLTTSS
jgi:hypothetical protein